MSWWDPESGEERVCCGTFNCSRCSVSLLTTFFLRTHRRLCCAAIWLPVLVLLALIATVLIRTLTMSERFELASLSEEEPVFLNPDNATRLAWARTLGGAIKIPTVSRSESDLSTEELAQLHSFLQQHFPLVFKQSPHVERRYVNTHSILLRVEGSQAKGKPYMLAGHLDVVPAGDLEGWRDGLDPFLGEVVEQDGDTFIFGRGAIDDKHSVVGILLALESMLQDGGQPQRTLYVAFGHDEEVSGHAGAGHIAVELEQMLEEKGEKLDFLLDEGMFVMQGVVPGVEDPVVYIGVVEKGWTTVNLTVTGQQSHSSAPPRESTIGILAAAVSRLEEQRSPARQAAA